MWRVVEAAFCEESPVTWVSGGEVVSITYASQLESICAFMSRDLTGLLHIGQSTIFRSSGPQRPLEADARKSHTCRDFLRTRSERRDGKVVTHRPCEATQGWFSYQMLPFIPHTRCHTWVPWSLLDAVIDTLEYEVPKNLLVD